MSLRLYNKAPEMLRKILFFISLFIFTNSYADFAQAMQLGHVAFATSTKSRVAQQHFIAGLKFLHNFMYPLALREFQLSVQSDPKFALGYWGQAMCYKWSLWSFQNKKMGRAVLAKLHAQSHLEMNALEKSLIDAIALVYAPGNDLANTDKYVCAMRLIYQQHPHNPDVVSLYALALIGYASDAPQEKKSMRYLQIARDILKKYLALYPQHPGIVHYFIHVNDLPNSPHLQEGLVAIPNIYKYMSDSSHVLHMPSHLYSALGDWSKAAFANKLSIQASEKMCGYLEKEKIQLPNIEDVKSPASSKRWTLKMRYACDADNHYHSLEWLQYADLEMQKFSAAKKYLNEMHKTHVANIEHDNKI